jgi:hypothetical protein
LSSFLSDNFVQENGEKYQISNLSPAIADDDSYDWKALRYPKWIPCRSTDGTKEIIKEKEFFVPEEDNFNISKQYTEDRTYYILDYKRCIPETHRKYKYSLYDPLNKETIVDAKTLYIADKDSPAEIVPKEWEIDVRKD